MWHIWAGMVLRDSAFFELLLEIDREILLEVWSQPCPLCAGRLHRGDFARKPRGEPKVPEAFSVRFSLCCSRDGCRRRLTPFSVRFLGRKVFVGVAVVLVAAALQGPSPAREKRLCELLGMTRRTARRWLEWWKSSFAGSDFFKSLRGLLRQPVERAEMPLGLLQALHRNHPAETSLALLKLLGPITSATAPGAQPL